MDIVSKEKRSEIMRKVRGKDTKPEKIVRSLLHSMGYRFRLHRKDLPGNPDIVLPKYKLVIFVHGCFWHRHLDCKKAQMPSTNVLYWKGKFKHNVARDKNVIKQLKCKGYRVCVVWECELTDLQSLAIKIQKMRDV